MSTERATSEELRQITQELSTLAANGEILPGSLQARHTYCGKPGCACQADPPRPHGPYWQWTRKASGKTITRRLTPEQSARYRAWIDNDHRIRQLITRLEQINIEHLTGQHHTTNQSNVWSADH